MNDLDQSSKQPLVGGETEVGEDPGPVDFGLNRSIGFSNSQVDVPLASETLNQPNTGLGDSTGPTELDTPQNALLYQYPPDVAVAKVHAECFLYGCKPAKQMGEPSDSEDLFCMCCNTVKPKQLPLCIHTDKLHHYGPTLPLYFG